MTLSDMLLFYARKGVFTPFRKSAFRKFCRRNRGRKCIAKCRNGFSMITIIGDSVDDQVFVYGVFEEAATRVVETLGPASDSFLDVGCNIGYYSCLFSAVSTGNQPLVAVDPNPAMIRRTAENLELNGFSGYKLLNCGIGAKSGRLTLHIPRFRHSLSSLAYVPTRGGPVEKIEVPIQPLDAVIRENDLNGILLKVDTEGFEYSVFSGLSERAARRVRFIVFELSAPNLRQAGRSPADILALPVLQPFDLYVLNDANGGAAEKTEPSVLAGDDDLNVNVLLVKKDDAAREAMRRSGLAG